MKNAREEAATIWANLVTDFGSTNVERHNKFINAVTDLLESRDKRIERLREALGKLAKGNRYPATLKLCKDALAADDALNADSGDVE